VLPQKSAIAYALDPDNKGAVVWKAKFGEGGGLGGQWGGAYDGTRAYFGLAEFLAPKPGGMNAHEPRRRQHPVARRPRSRCSAVKSAPAAAPARAVR
jgi:hypothetical protein